MAVKQFNSAIEYIRQDSPQNANKVKQQILGKIERLSKGNVVHRNDPCKTNNDGTYRYFIVLNYRVSYCETNAGVIIIRVRHESMEPENY